MAMGCSGLEKLKVDVQAKFDKIREALNIREKLLLRQIDVIASQLQKNITTPPSPPSSSTTEETKFIADNEDELLNFIRSFGKFNLDNINLALQDVYVNEDYISPAIDHETMYKCLNKFGTVSNGTSIDEDNENEEKIVVDFSSNRKLFKDNVSNLNESIINITLNEATELIRKSKPSMMNPPQVISTPFHLSIPESEDDTLTSQSKCSQTDLSSDKKQKQNFKPKITINNCNGTINLKNISNLTINCAKEDSFNGQVKTDQSSMVSTTTTPRTASDELSDSNSTMKDNENNSVTCEFYNRLINEIKNSLKQKTAPVVTEEHTEPIPTSNYEKSSSVSSTTEASNIDSSSVPVSSTTDIANRKFILKNFENLKVILESSDGNELHPVQIEQWLAEIISETEIEPMQNTEILEHSKIHNELC